MKKNEPTAPAPNTNDSDFEKIANRVSFITIVGNVLLSVIKLLAGIIAHSNAMISDAIHSASDVFSTIIVIIRKSSISHREIQALRCGIQNMPELE